MKYYTKSKVVETITWWQALKMLEGTYKEEIVKKKDCVYIPALNQKSALARYKSGKGGYIHNETDNKLDFF